MAHASSIRRLFRRILVASLAGPLPVTALIACTSGIAGPDLGDGTEGGGSEGGGSEGGAGSCRAAAQVDAPSCGTFNVPLTGNQSTCDFPETGIGATSSMFCASICGVSFASCMRSGSTTATCTVPCAVDGRRHALLDDRLAPSGHDVASYLARMAFYEAASVDAFELLARELVAHGAPASLVRSSNAARRDETRHARMAVKLARRHGAAVVIPPRPPAAQHRSLEAIAIENAVEGCVRETFGVLIGLVQAENAPTAELRGFFAALAKDEARHAALSTRVATWLASRLSVAARRRVDVARRRALAELEASLDVEPTTGLGLPDATRARALFAAWVSSDIAVAA